MQDPDFSLKLYGSNFNAYYNLKTEPNPREESETSQKSLLIHEDDVSQAEIATYVIKGIDELDISPENKEIIKNPNFFKHLSLSFYPKAKLNTDMSVGPKDQTLKTEDSRLETMESFRKATYKKIRLESPHSSDYSEIVKTAKRPLKLNMTQNKTVKLNLKLNETPKDPYESNSSGITPKNFQIRKTFVKSPREKRPLDFIANQIYSPRGMISPRALGHGYLPIETNESSQTNGSDYFQTEGSAIKSEKSQIAVLLSKKTQNPQMVNVSALKLELKEKDRENMKAPRKISFSKTNMKITEPTSRISLQTRMGDSTPIKSIKQHLDVVIPDFSFQKKENKMYTSPMMSMEPLLSPRRIKDQMLLTKKK